MPIPAISHDIWELAPFAVGALLELLTPLSDKYQERLIDYAIHTSVTEGSKDREGTVRLRGRFLSCIPLSSDLVHFVFLSISVITASVFIRLSHTATLSAADVLVYCALFIICIVVILRYSSAEINRYRETTILWYRRIPQICFVANLVLALLLFVVSRIEG